MMGGRLFLSKRTRLLLLLLAWIAVLALLWQRGPAAFQGSFGLKGSEDFIQYWSAARLLSRGENPYDPDAIYDVEQAAGWLESRILRTYNPPWTIALVLPLALFPFTAATLFWLLLQVGLLLTCGLLLWRFFAPGDKRYWIGPLLAVLFVPGISALRLGQITPWLLAGITGFLVGQRARRDLLAGAMLSLLMIKPHVAYLFWLAALWWAWRSRRWRVLLGWVGALLAASAVALLFAPDVFTNYLTMEGGAPLDWATPTLGGWLRYFLGLERRWLQFLPSILGLLGLVVWLWRRRGPWRWQKVTSPLLLASVLTTAYGWSYDQVVLLPVVIDLVAWLRWASVGRTLAVLAALAASQAVMWTLNRQSINELYHVWHAPVIAAIFWLGTRRLPKPMDAHLLDHHEEAAAGGI